MFQPRNEAVKATVARPEGNYLIRKNDQLTLRVFTNLGEKIVDPGPDQPTVQGTPATPESYLVDQQGVVKFPLVGTIHVEGLTLRQAEEMLEKEYAKFYEQPFVKLNYSNKRVVVLGTPEGQVIPLTNENMRLTEILALCKGITNDSKANNIRILRGDELLIADLSTTDGYRKHNYVIQPDDIIYIEPIRRPVSEAFRDYGPVVTVLASLATVVVVIFGVN
ncbi:MAG TPA: polysaccharide biosynthesis/export family protein [Chryseosolibacter sp.]|nr:polysaccharide biosynthesis/export family protein [Chryseosolibacter sp.]